MAFDGLGLSIATLKAVTVIKTTSQGRRNQVGDFQNGCCLNRDCLITVTATILTLQSTSE